LPPTNPQAIETPQGHGDTFWSVCMAIPDKEQAPDVLIEFI
jgi:hypothetical protein